MTNTNFRPVRAPKTAELVAHALRSQLVRGELPDGYPLPSEAELIVQFGVSRPTLREAFRILESEQLLSIQRGARGGARLQKPGPETAARYAGFILQSRRTTFADLWEARAAIEPVAARMLAARPEPAHVVALRQAVEAGEAVIGDRQAYARAAAQFHNLIIDLSANQTLRLFGEMTVELLATANFEAATRTPDTAVRRTPAAFRASQRTHHRFIDLIEEGDADGVESFWRSHVDAARNVWRGPVGERPIDILGRPD